MAEFSTVISEKPASMSIKEEKTPKGARGIKRFVPILSWLPNYDRSWLRADVIAGFTLWGLVVPEAMAYAGVADLPPQAGLYTLVVALLVYAILGTSRHLVVQATSATAALLASSVMTVMLSTASVEGADPNAYPAYASAFVLVTGLVFLIAGLARLGFITQFLSKPVMDGFVVGLAIFVIVGQLNKLFGVEKPEGNTIEKLVGILKELPQANWAAFAFGAGALLLLFLLPRLSKKLPAGLVVLFGAIVLSMVLNAEATYGVDVVGTLPSGLPSFAIPQVPLLDVVKMVLPAIGVLLVAFSESLGVAHEFAEKHGYEIEANQELNASAAANILSGLFGGMIAGGSMSASAVKEGAGARSQVTNLATWVATIVTLLFLTPLFAPLPEAVLAALIIHAVSHILASRKLLKIREESKTEFWFGVLTMIGVLLFDVLAGMIIGLLASLLYVIYRTSRPHVSVLGRNPSFAGVYSNLSRHPECTPVSDVLILRLDAMIYYGNALTVRDRIKTLVDDAEPHPKAVILDFNVQENIDVTSTHALIGLVKELKAKEVEPYLVEVHPPVLDYFRKTGLLAIIGEDHVFPTVEMAVQHMMPSNQGLPGPV